MLCKPNCWLLTPQEVYKVIATSQHPSFWWLLLTVGFFRKPEIGTGFPTPRGVKCVSELEDGNIGMAKPSVGQRGFWESCLLSCELGQFGSVKWKINKPERKGTQFETKCSLQPGCCQTSKHCSCEAWGIPRWRCFLRDPTDIYPAPTKCQALCLGLGTERGRDVVPAHREPTVYCGSLVIGFSTGENIVAFS